MIALSALLVALTVAVVGTGRAGQRSRLDRVVSPTTTAVTGEPSTISADDQSSASSAVAMAPWLLAAVALVLAPWPMSAVISVAVVVIGPRVIGRLEPSAVRQRRRQRDDALPLALDLLGAAWAAGVPPHRALEAVADAISGPLASDLSDVVARMSLGASTGNAWAGLTLGAAGDDAVRALMEATDSGIAPVAALRRASDASRQARRRRGEAAARTAAVRVAGPLGLCFLPAFVVLGIAPAVMGALEPALT